MLSQSVSVLKVTVRAVSLTLGNAETHFGKGESVLTVTEAAVRLPRQVNLAICSNRGKGKGRV